MKEWRRVREWRRQWESDVRAKLNGDVDAPGHAALALLIESYEKERAALYEWTELPSSHRFKSSFFGGDGKQHSDTCLGCEVAAILHPEVAPPKAEA